MARHRCSGDRLDMASECGYPAFPPVGAALLAVGVDGSDLHHAPQHLVIRHTLLAADEWRATFVDPLRRPDSAGVDGVTDRRRRREGFRHECKSGLREADIECAG